MKINLKEEWTDWIVTFTLGLILLYFACRTLYIHIEEQQEKDNKERAALIEANRRWREGCMAIDGMVVTYSYERLRWNYRNRYETVYKTVCMVHGVEERYVPVTK